MYGYAGKLPKLRYGGASRNCMTASINTWAIGHWRRFSWDLDTAGVGVSDQWGWGASTPIRATQSVPGSARPDPCRVDIEHRPTAVDN